MIFGSKNVPIFSTKIHGQADFSGRDFWMVFGVVFAIFAIFFLLVALCVFSLHRYTTVTRMNKT